MLWVTFTQWITALSNLKKEHKVIWKRLVTKLDRLSARFLLDKVFFQNSKYLMKVRKNSYWSPQLEEASHSVLEYIFARSKIISKHFLRNEIGWLISQTNVILLMLELSLRFSSRILGIMRERRKYVEVFNFFPRIHGPINSIVSVHPLPKSARHYQ